MNPTISTDRLNAQHKERQGQAQRYTFVPIYRWTQDGTARGATSFQGSDISSRTDDDDSVFRGDDPRSQIPSLSSPPGI